MRWPREAIDAAVLATAVRIYARLKTDIRAVVPRDDCLGEVAKELRLRPRLLFVFTGRIDLHHIGIAEIDMQFLEAVGRIPGSAPAMDRRRGRRRFLHDRNELSFCLLASFGHPLSSHEHIGVSS
jgi:hypothetical protein